MHFVHAQPLCCFASQVREVCVRYETLSTMHESGIWRQTAGLAMAVTPCGSTTVTGAPLEEHLSSKAV